MTRVFRPKSLQKIGKTAKSSDLHTHNSNRVVNPNELLSQDVLYSVTLRRGQGIDLGRNSPDSRFATYLCSISSRHALSIEKSGKEAHFQCLILTKIPLNIIKEKIRYIYFHWTDAQKRHALHIVPHNDIDILYEYVCKQFWVELPNMDHIYNPIWSTFGHRNREIPPEICYHLERPYVYLSNDLCKNHCYHPTKCINAKFHTPAW